MWIQAAADSGVIGAGGAASSFSGTADIGTWGYGRLVQSMIVGGGEDPLQPFLDPAKLFW